MGWCAVSHCNGKDEKHITLKQHRFPRNHSLQWQWIVACKRDEKFCAENARVCEKHFRSDQYKRDLKQELIGYSNKYQRLLEDDAVPCLHLGISDAGLQDVKKKLQILTPCLPTIKKEPLELPFVKEENECGENVEVAIKYEPLPCDEPASVEMLSGSNEGASGSCSSYPDEVWSIPSFPSRGGCFLMTPPPEQAENRTANSRNSEEDVKEYIFVENGLVKDLSNVNSNMRCTCNHFEDRTSDIAETKQHLVTQISVQENITCNHCKN